MLLSQLIGKGAEAQEPCQDGTWMGLELTFASTIHGLPTPQQSPPNDPSS